MRSIIADLRSLRTLKAIQESGSVADAAERLHLTPSALSHQLRELESAVGMPLLIRKTRPPQFSRAGERLLSLADLVLAAVRDAERDLSLLQAGSVGRLSLHIECGACLDGLMPLLGEFRNHWRDVEMDIKAGCCLDVMPALREGDVDVVLTSDPRAAPGCVAVRLFEYELQLVVAPDHPLALRPFVQPADLAGETLVIPAGNEFRQDIFRAFLTPAEVRPARLRHEDRSHVAVQLVASGRGVAAMPHWSVIDSLARGWIRSVRLGRDGIWCTQYATLREGDLQRAYIKDFIGTVRDAFLTQLSGVRKGTA